VFHSIHAGDPDPKLLAYQYLQTLPQLAQGQGNTVWMIPSELTGALKMLGSAFGNASEGGNAEPASAGRLTAAARSEPQAQSSGDVPATVDGATVTDIRGAFTGFDKNVPGPRSDSDS
jgi:hypothetical protein